MSAARKSPRRVRLTVPASDESVIAWLAVQDSVSASIRALVREYIEKDGYTDPTARPVRQLPRRGRPPANSEIPVDTGDDNQIESTSARVVPQESQAPQTTDHTAPDVRGSQPDTPRTTQPPRAHEAPAAQQQQTEQPTSDPGSTPGAVGVGAFLAASRDDD